MTPIELVQAWNALGDCLEQNLHQSKFTAQAKNILNDFTVQNEVHKWNELDKEEREIVKDKELDLDIEKIDIVPDQYSNSAIENLQPFFEVNIEPQETQIEKLLEQKDTDQ